MHHGARYCGPRRTLLGEALIMHHRHMRRRYARRARGRAGRGRFFGPGEVRLALLSLLSEGPKHGYELMQELEERSGGSYKASAGAVYPTLQQLEDEGLIRSETSGGKKVCTITEAGERELEELGDDVDAIWRRAEEWSEWGSFSAPEVAEVIRPMKRLMKVVYRSLAADPDRAEAIRDILREARDAVEGLADRERER